MTTSQAPTRAVLLDIEGTTTPIAFVHETLFPYASERVADYLAANFDSPEIIPDLRALREEHAADVLQHQGPPPLAAAPREAAVASLSAYARWLIDRDRKSAGLKSLQGKIWRQGYADGTLKAPLYADVLPAMERWRGAGLKLAIFSSGSVLAQKLLFAHTEAGDLTRLIDDYFDTTTGPKKEPDSYRRIASALGLPPPELLFISDVVAELDAAGAAGVQTLLSLRPGNPPQPPTERHRAARTFDEVA
jgi:enolase-phosphatase E1